MKLKQIQKEIAYQLSMLRYRPKLIWNQLWIRDDPNHESHKPYREAVMHMHKSELVRYTKNCEIRLGIAILRQKRKQNSIILK